MPVDLSMDIAANDEESNGFDERSSLRVSLIGNKDLKYKILRDAEQLSILVNDFDQLTAKIIAQSSEELVEADTLISDLETSLVILKILITFISEIKFSEKFELEPNLKKFNQLINPINKILKYYMKVLLPLVYYTSVDLVQKFESIVRFSLEIFISLNNLQHFNLHFDDESGLNDLWKFVTSLLILTDGSLSADENDFNPIISSNLLSCLLKLVPLLLSKSAENPDTNRLMISLLSVLLKRLENECDLICKFHLPNLTNNEFDFFLKDLTFKNSKLPNIEPNYDFFNSKINLSLLIDLITSIGQIFSQFNDSNDHLIMIIPNTFNNNSKSPTIILSNKIYFTLLLLLKFDNKYLNLVSLNLIHFYLNNVLKFNEPTKEIKHEIIKNYRKILPRIIDLLDYEFINCQNELKYYNRLTIPKFLKSPIKILTILTKGFKFIKDEIRRCNVDYKILNNLGILVKSDSSLENMYLLKKLSENGKKMVNFTLLIDLENNQKNLNNNISKLNKTSKIEGLFFKNDQLENLSDYLLLLSIYVSEDEEYRHRIVDYQFQSGPKNLLAQLTFELIDNYRFLLIQIQMIYNILYNKNGSLKIKNENDLNWFGKNLGIIFTIINHEFYYSIFHLIRSLSRSVSTLRTFFVECNSFASILDLSNFSNSELVVNDNGIGEPLVTTTNLTLNENHKYVREGYPTSGSFISSILHILKINEESEKVMKFFIKDELQDLNNNFKINNSTNKLLILGSIANFVLEFGSFRYDVVNDENFLKNLNLIYENSLQPSKNYADYYYNQYIQLTIFQILKNYSYNENEENKMELLSSISINAIFEKSLYGLHNEINEFEEENQEEVVSIKIKTKILSFDIFRNLTAGSLHFSEQLNKFYQEYYKTNKPEYEFNNPIPSTWENYLIQNILNFELFTEYNESNEGKLDKLLNDDEFLVKLLLNEEYVKFITSINYIEDHCYTNISNFNEENFPLKELMKIWKRFITLRIDKSIERRLIKNDLNLKIELNNNLNEIRLSISWIIINLTYQNEEFGINYPDSNNYKLYDMIKTGSQSERLSSGKYGIVIEDSDEDETPKPESNQDLLNAETRAKILYEEGFVQALNNLYFELSSTKSEEIKRFDSINSNSLLEKIKSAILQIISLVDVDLNQLQDSIPQGEDRQKKRRRSSNIITSRGRRVSHNPESALPIIYSGTLSRTRYELNRGGEGFGYGSDEEYLDAQDQPQDQPTASSSASESTSPSASPSESDASSSEIEDDYWVR